MVRWPASLLRVVAPETDLSFSCVRMSHVIEHVPDPRCFLEKAIDLLDDDGIIVM
jgi:2-polyprenyl-3-methyl-5-hydroxy-6-metoxy-1,4-benzoquinol methylase